MQDVNFEEHLKTAKIHVDSFYRDYFATESAAEKEGMVKNYLYQKGCLIKRENTDGTFSFFIKEPQPKSWSMGEFLKGMSISTLINSLDDSVSFTESKSKGFLLGYPLGGRGYHAGETN